MSQSIKTIAFLCALLMVGAAIAPFAVMADNNEAGNVGPAANLSVEQLDDRSVLITVTDDEGVGVPDVNVTVELDDDEIEDGEEIYDEVGEHQTSDDGTVTLEPPDRPVTIVVTVEGTDLTETIALEGPVLEVSVEQDPDASVTIIVTDDSEPVDEANITVDADNGYEDGNEYTDVEDGILELSAPENTVDVTIIAEYEDREAILETTLYNATDLVGEDRKFDNFGQQVSAFVHMLQGDDEIRGIGPHVASFVTENNPGNPPAHAGPPAWLTDDDVDREPGPPDHAGPKDDGEDRGDGPPDHAGPPEHAGPPSNSGNGEDTSSNNGGNGGGGGGPPDHAGGPP